ncbi:Ku protein [Streptomyces sp. TP-A0356]|uniref:non-homologous end joining protein Ku n=1 Tax=Streptomyces sp. TP-A0356 TaxID=1359208 RepID=UPI0006E12A96|nr:Ku protein [Streptomyces sp. TP-A0356]
MDEVAQAVWTGWISFGLVSMPVRLFPATREHLVQLHEVHAADGSRIRHRRVCEAEGREVDWQEVAKGYQTADGRTVVLREEDLEALPLPSRHVIEVLGFVPVDGLDPILFSRAYYAAPQQDLARRPYALLVAALTRAERAAVAKVTLCTRERLAAVWPRRETLVVQTLLWPEEVREPGGPAVSAPLTGQELELGSLLMAQLPEPDFSSLHDEYAAALQQLVTAKETGGELARLADPEPAVDLVAALEASLRTAADRKSTR